MLFRSMYKFKCVCVCLKPVHNSVIYLSLTPQSHLVCFERWELGMACNSDFTCFATLVKDWALLDSSSKLELLKFKSAAALD